MKTYSVLFAEDVPHYGTANIEAPDDEAASAAATAFEASTLTHDPDWSSIVCRRIVSIEDPHGEIIATDVPLGRPDAPDRVADPAACCHSRPVLRLGIDAGGRPAGRPALHRDRAGPGTPSNGPGTTGGRIAPR